MTQHFQTRSGLSNLDNKRNIGVYSIKNTRYDWTRIKETPILDVCAHFGINVIYKSGQPWCSLRRDDKTPSTLLHTDPSGRYHANTFYDFGSHEGGDNISLACNMLGLDSSNKEHRYLAADHLTNAFNIPTLTQGRKRSDDLSNSEYALLGLYGDNATKNFQFSPDRQTHEKMQEISEKYDMPMNELKRKHPGTYERLIKMIAIPTLQDARNNFYMHVWNTRRFLCEVMGKKVSIMSKDEFASDISELKAMERALSTAIRGTKLTPLSEHDYDPDHVLERIDAGELKPTFSGRTYNQLKRLTKVHNTAMKIRTVEINPVLYDGEALFKDIPYSAFLEKGKAKVRYLEKDTAALRPIFEQISPSQDFSKKPQSINDKLSDAKKRQAEQASPAAQATRSEPQH